MRNYSRRLTKQEDPFPLDSMGRYNQGNGFSLWRMEVEHIKE